MLALYWPSNAAAVCSGVLVMAFGDGLAGLLGRQIPSPDWKIWNQRKSLLGTLTMGIVTLIILTSITLLVDNHINPLRIIVVTLAIVILEQISKWGLDNLTVPLAVALTWSWMTTS